MACPDVPEVQDKKMETEVNLDGLPFLLLADVRKLPNCPAVYFVLASDGKCIYVGSTKSLARRWLQHDKREKFIENGAFKVVWVELPENSLISRERAYVECLQPILNRKTPMETGTVKIALVGGSLAVRIPQHAVRALDIKKGDEAIVELIEELNALYVRVVRRPKGIV